MEKHFMGYGSRALLVILILVFLVLVPWVILNHTLSFALSKNVPDIALQFNARNAEAALRVAEAEAARLALKKLQAGLSDQTQVTEINKGNSGSHVIDQNTSDNSPEKLTEQIREALKTDPLNSALLRLLAQVNSLKGETAKQAPLMAKASALSLREIIAHDFMFRYNLRERKYRTAIYYADRLFSSAPELIGNYAKIFNLLLSDNKIRGEITRVIAANPVWRQAFFSRLVPKLDDRSTDSVMDIFEELAATSYPPTNIEMSTYLNQLIAKKKYTLAYAAWLRFLPVDRAETLSFINNGDFEIDPSGMPFDWNIFGGKEARAKIISMPGENGRRGLNVEFGQGRVKFPAIFQYLALAPGRYLVEGSYSGEIAGRRGLVWSVDCVGSARVGESEMILGRFRQWRPFEFDIEIPEKSCELQKLVLIHSARSPSEEIVSGSIWFDRFAVTRKE